MVEVVFVIIVLLSLAGIEFRLRRIEKKLRVLVPDPPPKPLVVIDEKFRDV
jgi:hypothetical protein